MEKLFKIYKSLLSRDNKQLFLISTSLLLLGIIIGFLFQSQIGESGNKDEVYIPTEVGALLINNLQAIGLIVLGIFTFSILTIILLTTNGIFIGLTISSSLADGMPISEVIIKLIPHGIFELPAIIASGIIGLKSLQILLKVTLSKQTYRPSLKSIGLEIFILSCTIIILITLSAFIEIFITP